MVLTKEGACLLHEIKENASQGPWHFVSTFSLWYNFRFMSMQPVDQLTMIQSMLKLSYQHALQRRLQWFGMEIKCGKQHVQHASFQFHNSLLLHQESIYHLFYFQKPDQKQPCFLTGATFSTQPSSSGLASQPWLFTKVFLQIAAFLQLLEANFFCSYLNKQHFFSPRQKALTDIIHSRYFLRIFKFGVFAGFVTEITRKRLMEREVSGAWLILHRSSELYFLNENKKPFKCLWNVSTNTQKSPKIFLVSCWLMECTKLFSFFWSVPKILTEHGAVP